jgi:hypothetical protein
VSLHPCCFPRASLGIPFHERCFAKSKLLVGVLVIAFLASAQGLPPPVGSRLPQTLVQLLELTPDQITNIDKLNSSFLSFSLEKSLRAAPGAV